MRYLVEMVLKATDRATAPIRGVRKQMDHLRGRVSAFSRSVGFHRVSDSVKALTRPLNRLRGSVSGLLVPIGALASFGTVALFAGWIGSASAAADELAKFADRTGMSVEQVQKFEFAMSKMAGATGEEVRTGLRDLVKNIGEAASGASKDMADLFKALNIDPNEIKDNTGKALELLAERFERIPDVTTRAAVAQRLFGEGGAKMAEALHDGRDAIQEQFASMERFGLVSEKGAREAEKHANRMTDLSAAFTGFGVSISEQVLPVIGPWIEYVTELIVAHKDLIATDIAGFAKDAAYWLFGASDAAAALAKTSKDGFPEVGGAIGWLGDLFHVVRDVVDAFGGLDNVLIGIVAVALAPFLAAIAQMAMAFVQLGVVMLTTPFGWILGAIAALVAAGVWLYRNFEPVKRLFDGIFDGVSEKIDRVRDAFGESFWKGIVAYFDEFNPATLIYESLAGLINWIKNEWGSEIRGAVEGVWTDLTDSIGSGLRKFNPFSDDGPTPTAAPKVMAPPPFVGGTHGMAQVEMVVRDETGRVSITRQRADGVDLKTDLEQGEGLLSTY